MEKRGAVEAAARGGEKHTKRQRQRQAQANPCRCMSVAHGCGMPLGESKSPVTWVCKSWTSHAESLTKSASSASIVATIVSMYLGA